jgi:putative component of toxin-antitoxin plasmid stabilization module
VADSGEWDVEFYADEQGREPCREWADDLSPQKRAAFIEAVRLVLARRGLGVVESEYGKALGGGLYELRVRWSAAEIRHKVQGLSPDNVGKAPEKIMLRVFFCTSGRKIILLMSGYDKAKDASDRRQEREIAKARRLLRAHQEAAKRGWRR